MRQILIPLLFILMAQPLAAQQPVPPPAAPPVALSAAEASRARELETYLRTLYGWGSDFTLKVGAYSDSIDSGFYEVPVDITYQGQTERATFYVSKDGKTFLRGEIFDMKVDPYAKNREILHPEGNPSRGPADAKVTIVEFSDFQCPHCRLMYQLWKELEPQYPQVRFVFENFPITRVHPWAMTAALAGRCVFQAKPEAFWKFHDAIFENQASITPEDAYAKIQGYAADAGLKPDGLQACISSPEAKAAVDRNIAEANLLKVDSTPTLFINGHPMVGSDKFLLNQLLLFSLPTK